MYAVRNIRLCTKDCLCLYVCPTGAADTENSIIDRFLCTGCGACATSCPSGAISMMVEKLPPQQPKTDAVVAAQRALAKSKVAQENKAAGVAASAQGSVSFRLAKAIEKSNRIMAEDILREAGYLLPQSANAHLFLQSLLAGERKPDFPQEVVERLLDLVVPNETIGTEKGEQWECAVCGYVHDGSLPADFVCPVCGQPASAFSRVAG
ncbi:MAG: 4Fe-4S binding protein [Raoultibacter sp.]